MARIAAPDSVASRAEMIIEREYKTESPSNIVVAPRGLNPLAILPVNHTTGVVSGHLGDAAAALPMTGDSCREAICFDVPNPIPFLGFDPRIADMDDSAAHSARPIPTVGI